MLAGLARGDAPRIGVCKPDVHHPQHVVAVAKRGRARLLG